MNNSLFVFSESCKQAMNKLEMVQKSQATRLGRLYVQPVGMISNCCLHWH